jgi:hypothetical protein
MSETADVRPHATDEIGEVRTDLACQRCGYNLRGLNASGQCPECGAAVSLALRDDLLCYADPAYVKGLARGCQWILRGSTLLVSGIILIPVGVAAISSLGAAKSWKFVLPGIAASLAILAVLFGSLAFLEGVWLFTGSPPRSLTVRRQDKPRRLIRVCVLVTVIGFILCLCIEALGPTARMKAATEFLEIGLSVVGAIGVTAYFRYLSRVAHRVSMKSRGRYVTVPEHATRLAYGFALVLAWIVLVNAVAVTAFYGPVLLGDGRPFAALRDVLSLRPDVVIGCMIAPAGFVLLVLVVAAALLHHRMRAALRQEAVRAGEHCGEASAEGGA